MEQQEKTKLLTTHKFVVKEAHFVNKEKGATVFKLKPTLSKKISKLEDNKFEVSLKAEIVDTQEDPFPFELSAIISLITIFNDVSLISEKELERYLNVTCVQMLFPYLRSIVTSLTSIGMVNPIVLPILNVEEFAKQHK